jgi:hypothetical protein
VELTKYQNQLQDPNVLPCISVEDIPKEIEKVDFKVYKLAHGTIRLKKISSCTTLTNLQMELHL